MPDLNISSAENANNSPPAILVLLYGHRNGIGNVSKSLFVR